MFTAIRSTPKVFQLSTRRTFCSAPVEKPPTKVDPKTQTIDNPASSLSLPDFLKCEIKVAKVITADTVPGADKLLKLTLDVGSDKIKTVFSGIKSAYQPHTLVGKNVLCLTNLAPRKMKFGVSEGMILAASDAEGKEIFLTTTDDGAKPGMRVL